MKELLAVIRNRNLALLLSGRIVSAVGDALYQIALSVFVYHSSGNHSFYVGVLWLVLLIPSLILSPIGGSLAGRIGYRRCAIAADVVRLVLVLGLAVGLGPGTWPVVYPLAFVIACFGTLFRPATVGLIPALVDSPDELLATNSAIGQVQSLAMIVGSALAGVAAGEGLINLLLLGDAATFGLSALSYWLIRPRQTLPESTSPGHAEAGEIGVGWVAGFRLVSSRPLLVFAATAMALPELASGAVVVWFVPFSVHNIHMGNAGVGYLYAAAGAGALIGGTATALIGGDVRLDRLLAVSVAIGGVALALFGVSSVAATALLFIVILGIVESSEYAAFGTLVQQAVPSRAIGQASGTLESLLSAMMLIGSASSGILATVIGVVPSIVGLGIATVVVTGLAWLNLRVRTAGRPTPVDLCRIPAFAAVPEVLREWAVRRMIREYFPAGSIIFRQGDVGDKFYAIGKGVVQVELASDGQTITRELGPGEFFGEIALLHNVPRTATVSVLKPLTAYVLGREDFHELQERESQFKESLLATANARLQEDASLNLALPTMRT